MDSIIRKLTAFQIGAKWVSDSNVNRDTVCGAKDKKSVLKVLSGAFGSKNKSADEVGKDYSLAMPSMLPVAEDINKQPFVQEL